MVKNEDVSLKISSQVSSLKFPPSSSQILILRLAMATPFLQCQMFYIFHKVTCLWLQHSAVPNLCIFHHLYIYYVLCVSCGCGLIVEFINQIPFSFSVICHRIIPFLEPLESRTYGRLSLHSLHLFSWFMLSVYYLFSRFLVFTGSHILLMVWFDFMDFFNQLYLLVKHFRR